MAAAAVAQQLDQKQPPSTQWTLPVISTSADPHRRHRRQILCWKTMTSMLLAMMIAILCRKICHGSQPPAQQPTCQRDVQPPQQRKPQPAVQPRTMHPGNVQGRWQPTPCSAKSRAPTTAATTASPFKVTPLESKEDIPTAASNGKAVAALPVNEGSSSAANECSRGGNSIMLKRST
mmetsp:Transcript_178/g.437  ORF Transcript_178/g.437 Transcript_178/m.437 type:complete len:177 (+) Transcript_178:1586-2116(+)